MKVRGLFIDHGQAAANQEEAAVRALASKLQIEVSACRLSNASKLKAGELIGRNAMLIFAGLFIGECKDGILAIGIHAGTEYYDCSPAFLNVAARLVSDQTDGKISLLAPFLDWTKKDVFDYFLSAKLPLELTYSCEAGTVPVCGKCASCRDRQMLS
jgi:7-cyano-7-deazaguanine synthase